MKKVWKLLRVLLLLFFGSSIGAVILFRFVPVPVTPLMIIRAVNPQGTDTQKERERHWQHQ